MRALAYFGGKLSNIEIPAGADQVAIDDETILTRHGYRLTNDLVDVIFHIYSVNQMVPLTAIKLAREAIVEGINAM